VLDFNQVNTREQVFSHGFGHDKKIKAIKGFLSLVLFSSGQNA
jgi:hypothetical protein